jgi:integrase
MLTDIEIRNAKPIYKNRKLFDSFGLFLLITPNGSKLWRFRYRFAGVERALALGAYPQIGVRQARERRDEARQELALGKDPSIERKLKKMALNQTFKGIATEWLDIQEATAPHADRSALKPITMKKARWLLNKYVYPEIGSRPITLISVPELLRMLKKIERRGLHESAHRARARCSQIWRYAVVTGRAPRDITQDLRGALAPVVSSHHAALTDAAEIGELLRKINGYAGRRTTTLALKIAPYVFVRPGELRNAEWREFALDRAEWRIPAERMKMRAPHVVPLSTQVVALLEELKKVSGTRRHLFPAQARLDRAMAPNTINLALRSLGYSTEQMTNHGFRSLACTCLNEQGWDSDWIEVQLAHAESNKVRAAYNHARYLPQRRQMMQAWADYLDKVRADTLERVAKAA